MSFQSSSIVNVPANDSTVTAEGSQLKDGSRCARIRWATMFVSLDGESCWVANCR